MGLEPLEAHRHSVANSPHVAMFARDGYAANRPGPREVGKDHYLVACIDDALDLDLEVLVCASNDAKALASMAGTRLHGVLGFTYSRSAAMKSRADSSRSQAS